jgi:uncharacterized protein (TIGR02996 family)
MSTDREAFIRAICEQPDDDTPRLVYADWLDENGDAIDRARARYIRHQIAEAFHNKNVWCPAFEALVEWWDNGPGKEVAGPIKPDRNTAVGQEYFLAYGISQLMGTQSRLMLEKFAGQWLEELMEQILTGGYYQPSYGKRPKTKSGLMPPKCVVRRDDWRDWIEFKTDHLASGPVFHFRRGFLNQINYGYFYQDFSKTRLIEIFRQHPIERVRTHHEPNENHMIVRGHEEEVFWTWSHDKEPDEQSPWSMIPTRIYNRLPHLKAVRGLYPDKQSAVADFQWACIALGRELAGLPMLPVPPVPTLPDPKKKTKPRKAHR